LEFWNKKLQSKIRFQILFIRQNKIAFTYKSGESAVYLNGNQIATDSDSFTLAVPLTQLGLCNINSSVVGYAKISVAALWKTRLSNAELTTLTTI
jgi:hypothetical protein